LFDLAPKVDIMDAEKCAKSLDYVRAVTCLGKSLGISIVAEGVDTNEQLGLLRTEGCTEVQGFLFSRPRPGQDAEAMLSYELERGAA
jgi:EAL domain-containing protein (putative c-di-GMP-specific phosphodiesterase class I)